MRKAPCADAVLRRLGLSLLALWVVGCASLPPKSAAGLSFSEPMQVKSAARHVRIEQYVDPAMLRDALTLSLPRTRIAAGAFAAPVTIAQAELVVNHAARTVCQALAPYARFVRPNSQTSGTAQTELVLTAITPTATAASGASALIGVFVPGPFRLPAGMGALSMDAETRRDNTVLAAMQWARGANPILDDAQLSEVGDAWQLAQRFGNDFARLLIDTDAKRSGIQRVRLARERIKENRAYCTARFGRVNLAGRGAAIMLPVAPEWMDAGAPKQADKR